MRLLRIIDKVTGVFIRDDFTLDKETEIGLDIKPAQGFILPKWNFELEKWEEAGEEYIQFIEEEIPTNE